LNPLEALKLYAFPLAVSAAFGFGLYVSHVYHGYQEDKNLKEVQAQLVKQNKIDNSSIVSLQTKLASSEQDLIILKGKLDEIKVTDVPCTVTPAAIRVWNHTKPQPVPKDTPRVTEAPTTTSGAESKPIEGVGVKLLIENKLENDNICNGLRDQLDAIIKWNKDTYGE
jgi:hypothetical protein